MADESFFSRWSRRKAQQTRDAEPTPAVLPARRDHADPGAAALAPQPTAVPVARPVAPEAQAAVAVPDADPLAAAPPTLDDVAQLTRDSDYSRFVARDVDPGVQRAALKQLFSDPHFNVMDGLDVYIDDYGKPDPIPPGMLRQMVQSQLLGLFKDDDDGSPAPDDAPPPSHATPAATPVPVADPAASPADEDTDLQLQPDDGAGRAGDRARAGEDAGRQH